MTKETLRQQIVLRECVTPNMPKIRGSFFNRKYRESGGSTGHLTPSTPQTATSRSGNKSSGSSTRSRTKRSGVRSDSLGLSNGSSKNGGRPTRSRPSSDEYFEPDFSTPRATRASLLTPVSSGTMKKDGKITHFYYRPLELDNESSSDSMDDPKKKLKANQDEPARIECIPDQAAGDASGASQRLASEQKKSKLTTNTLKDGKITHFYYRPLELDNETSSESMDIVMRRKQSGSQAKSTQGERTIESTTKTTTALKRLRNEIGESTTTTATTATGWQLHTTT